MLTVHIGIGHDDDAIVAERLFQLFVGQLVANINTDRGDERGDFVVGQQVLHAGFFHIEWLSTKRENRLNHAIAARLRGATGRISLDEKEF